MIHHTELLRTESDGNRPFSAPLGNYLNEVDCGIAALPCLTKCLRLEKCAKVGVFVTVLSLVGFFHGTILNYFRGTSHIWSVHYNISQETIDWLIYTNEAFVGVFALCVAYWGNRIHRASWIGGLTMFVAVACVTLVVPEIYNPISGKEIDSAVTGPPLCGKNTRKANINTIEKDLDIITFAILIIFQILFAMATVSFIAHGVTYIDDHTSAKHSPGFIGLALAANEVGKQAGIYLSWAPYVINIDSIFVSPVWIVLTILTFLMGVIISLFPQTLPKIVLMKSVNSLLSLASGNNTFEVEPPVDGFFKSLWRILKNKILLINIFSLVLIQSGLINFSILQKPFNQSKYHLSQYIDASGYSDPFLIQFTTNLLKQPITAVSLVTSGMVIAKLRPRAKYLVIWNIVVFKLVVLFFASTIFWNCASDIENEHKHSITIPGCSSTCGCVVGEPFHPVCVDRKTYFSPCLAGCKNFSSEHNMYQKCSCGKIVTDGSCDKDDCKLILALTQVNSIITSGLLATTLVSSIVINLRCVSSEDKALALGLEYTFLGLIPYIPIRLIYHTIADKFCEIKGRRTCQFYSEYFTIFLSHTTIALMVLASILATVLLFFLGDLELYKNKKYKSTSDIDIIQMRRNTNETDNDDDGIENVNLHIVSGEEGAHHQPLQRRQMSDGKLNMPHPRSKEDRISVYLSEGQLVPPLKPPIKRGDLSASKSSANSGLSTDSLKAIANGVGDDHDSDTFSDSEINLPEDITPHRKGTGNIVETEF